MRNVIVALGLVMVIVLCLRGFIQRADPDAPYIIENAENRDTLDTDDEPEVIDPDNGIKSKPVNKLMAESVTNSRYIPDNWPNKRHSWKSIQMG